MEYYPVSNLIKVTPGSDLGVTVNVTQSISGGLPVDMTGYAAVAQVRTVQGVLVTTFTCDMSSAPDGVVQLNLTPAQTALLVPSPEAQYVWGLRLTAPDLTVIPEINGGVIVRPEVVQWP